MPATFFAFLLFVGASAPDGKCVPHHSEPVDDPRLRPSLTVACDYGEADLERRILALLESRRSTLTIEAVEQMFALPRLYTGFDAPRIARFDVILAAAPGRGDWRVMLNFTEGFYPTDAARRPRFTGTERPVLIDPRRRGDLRLELDWLRAPGSAVDTQGCLTEQRLQSAAKRGGWRVEHMISLPTHAPRKDVSMLRRGRVQAGADFDDTSGCIEEFTWERPADPGAR